jgi:hypothetical protein
MRYVLAVLRRYAIFSQPSPRHKPVQSQNTNDGSTSRDDNKHIKH